MGTETNKEERNTPEYLAQLLKDKKQIQAFPNVFHHLERILDEEINKVRVSLFHINGVNKDSLTLPPPEGPVVTMSEKLYVPLKDHPDFNFVGRILGPRGMTAKQLEQDTGCKIMVRGKGSMRDKKKETEKFDKPNWEHLREDLHVLITVEDTSNRAEVKLQRAAAEVRKLLVPAAEGEDNLKKLQLMELAILKEQAAPRLLAPTSVLQLPQSIRNPNPAGAPILLTSPRLPTPQIPTSSGLMGGPPPLVSPAESGLLYNPYDYPYQLATSPGQFIDYAQAAQAQAQAQAQIQQTAEVMGAMPKVRRELAQVRHNPYARVTL
ncbi:unnamed protein product [Owenia fusiformis]|uniref:K Homology domain-containing protein n=1 Tax=Owenia fusiformis TaxID=6347 RepID=A0A8S4Q2X0_OWEFU|nr:unnamed protein product [Owenia fusiformis]